MKHRRYIIITFGLICVLAAFLLFNNKNEQATRFRTAEVTQGDIAQVVTAVGTINPVVMVSVGTQVSGQITKMYVKVSDEVKKGQLLAEIDPSIAEAQLKQSKNSMQTARIAYEQAARDLERTKMLLAKEYVAKIELERAEQTYISARNNFEAAQVQVERDEVNLGYTKITSPIDGTIIQQEVTQGQTLAANFQTPNLFKIAGDLTEMQIDVNFSEADISKVVLGLPVKFTVDAFPDKEFKGTVDLVNLNPATGGTGVTYSVIVSVKNPKKILLPGMTAYVSVILSEKKNVLRVPAAALRFTPPLEESGSIAQLLKGENTRFRFRGEEHKSTNSKFNGKVYILKSQQPELVEVRTGATDETYVEISAGDIKKGDRVIIGVIPRIDG